MARKYLEICKILTGNIERDDNGVILAAEKKKGFHINQDYAGRYNGARAAKILGLSVRNQKFEIKGNIKPTTEACYRELLGLGSPVSIDEPENADAVLIWRYFLNPVILAMQIDGRSITITAFTARQPFGQVACFRMMNKFYKSLSDLLEVKEGGSLADRDKRKSKKERKQEKAQKKEEDKKAKEAAEKEKRIKAARQAKAEKAEKTEKTAGQTAPKAERPRASAAERTAADTSKAKHAGKPSSSAYKGKHSK